MGVSPAGGTQLYIGTTASVGSTDTFTLVGSLNSIGPFGVGFNEIKFEDLGLNEVFKFKAARDDGSITVALGKDLSDAGQAALLAAALVKDDYNIKVTYNDSQPAQVAASVSITAASPGAVTDTAHELAANTPVKYVVNGAGVLPTGIVSGTTYYTKTITDANTYTLSATAGGSAIVTSGSPSGTYTRTTVPVASFDIFKAKVMSYKTNVGNMTAIIGADVTLSVTPGTLATTARNPA